jgi:hypothetical protein
MYSQIIAQTMVSSLMKNIVVVPTIVISKDIVKIFMYDPGNDLLYESTQMKLFRERGRPVLNTHSVLALCLPLTIVNFVLAQNLPILHLVIKLTFRHVWTKLL